MLMSWADTSYPYGLIRGMPARSITMDEVLDGWQSHNFAIMEQLKPGLHDEVLLEQSEADGSQRFRTEPMTHSQLLRRLQGEPRRWIPRCIIVQREETHHRQWRHRRHRWSVRALVRFQQA